MKRYLAFLGAAMFFVACTSLYLMMESVSSGSNAGYGMNYNGLPGIEEKIKQIESDLVRNHKTIDMIKETVKDFAKKGNKADLQRLHVALGIMEKGQISHTGPLVGAGVTAMHMHQNYSMFQKPKIQMSHEMCSFATEKPKKTDIQMMDVFEEMPFDNPDGGVWKQGYPISYSPSQWDSRPLMVYVVPHSHTDPGWLKTFEKYYTDQTRHILNNMVDKLEAFPKMRFIYAEMSFFSMWWNEIDQTTRDRVRKLLKDKRFEVVTGGWVMTDEANAHYFAMLDQLIEGNQWLLNQVGVKPESGWAIDPFGHSSTMPYLLQGMGLDNMLLQRTHYSIKKYLSQKKQLEFMWRQNWDHSGDTDILCHMMPFYSYDVPHTCGPDPSICCQFDFKRLPGGKISCPWKVAPTPITDANVELKAKTLLDQYRKKSQLYRNEVVLIPLGDDFRYDKAMEWDQQYTNYQKLFDYMNSRKDWNVQAQFGTLSDYFHAIHFRAGSQPGAAPTGYPTLSGDFFSYSDRDDHYWSGYYTSRPFYKRLDRELEAHLRGGEILYSLAVNHARHLGLTVFPEQQLMEALVKARRNLALYQHHDGITGTAKDFVVVDYGTKMVDAVRDLKKIIKTSAEFLITNDKSQYKFSEATPFFDVDEQRLTHDSLPDKTILVLRDHPKSVVFYNSLAHTRRVTVRVYVSEAHVMVTDGDGKVIQSQSDPYWLSLSDAAKDKFRLTFVVTVPALGLSTYSIKRVPAGSNPSHALATVTVYNSITSPAPQIGGVGEFTVNHQVGEIIPLETADIKVKVSTKTGTLQEITTKEDQKTTKTQVEFLMYGVRSHKEKSGAYLFLPDGPAQPLSYNVPMMRVMKGPVLSEVQSFLPEVEHSISLYNSPGLDALSVDIYNLVDIRSHINKELVMRVQTDVKNQDVFYTDLNGFQIQKRKFYHKIPLQANFYPMPTMIYIEDTDTRFSVLSGQSLGCAALQPGAVEVMQDRRLNQDDSRGLGQGVLDNKKTPNRFRLLIERRSPGAKPIPSQPTGYPSLVSHLASQELIHPVVVLPQSLMAPPMSLLPQYHPLKHDLSCDLHVVNLRTMQNSEDVSMLRFKPKEEVALILHRLGIDCSFPARGMTCPLEHGQVIFDSMFQDLKVGEAKTTSLNLLRDPQTLQTSANVQVPVMEIKAYKLSLK